MKSLTDIVSSTSRSLFFRAGEVVDTVLTTPIIATRMRRTTRTTQFLIHMHLLFLDSRKNKVLPSQCNPFSNPISISLGESLASFFFHFMDNYLKVESVKTGLRLHCSILVKTYKTPKASGKKIGRGLPANVLS